MSFINYRRGLAGAIFCLMLSAPVAQAASGGVINFQEENDLFGDGSDQHFTHGMLLTWLTPPETRHEKLTEFFDLLPFFEHGRKLRFSFGLGQNMYTPQNISRTVPDPADRPYAGWLYGSAGMVSESDGRILESLELNLGMVGPSSFAEDVQTTFHQWINSPRPEGWSHQLKNEPGVVLYYESKQRVEKHNPNRWIQYDFTPHIGGALGNVFTYAAAGATFRIGDGLPSDYGPPRIRPSLPGSGFFESGGAPFAWYLFGGVEGRVVARNIFLDGNTFAGSASVERNWLVGDLQGGLVITLKQVRLAYTHIVRSKEFDSQSQSDQFGAISVSFAY